MCTIKESEKDKVQTFSLNVQCKPSETRVKPGWECSAKAIVSVIHPKKPGFSISRKIERTHREKSQTWGYLNFMTMKALRDKDKGYIKDNKVMLMLELFANTPHGVQ